MKNLVAVILAAGRGTRMKSSIPKVMHDILGKPMISYVIDLVNGLGADEIFVVAGYKKDLLKDALKGVKVVVQKELLGSGDAVNAAGKALKGYSGDILVVCGDTPILERDVMRELVKKHERSSASATILTAELKNPSGYGRIARNANGAIERIIEDVEASIFEKVITEINVGAYCFKAKDLFGSLEEIKSDNKKKEYFLTDVIGVLHKKGKKVEFVSAPEDTRTIIGINSRRDLAEAVRILKDAVLESLMENGVTIVDPSTTVIEPGVEIGADSVIYPNTVIETGVKMGKSCKIGPFARIRGGVELADCVEVGNFVELVRTKVGQGTKIKHHTYLGDATLGKDVNIGAGTITANYDGKNKNKTVIEDKVFVGVGSILIAPLRIGEKAVVGAGCVIPKNRHVAPGSTVVGVPARVLKK